MIGTSDVKNCLGCYTLIFSVVFVMFGTCAAGYWETCKKLNDIDKTMMLLSSSISAHTGVSIIK